MAVNSDCLFLWKVIRNTLVICRTVLHDLSALAICRTMQINCRPTEIIIYFWK